MPYPFFDAFVDLLRDGCIPRRPHNHNAPTVGDELGACHAEVFRGPLFRGSKLGAGADYYQAFWPAAGGLYTKLCQRLVDHRPGDKQAGAWDMVGQSLFGREREGGEALDHARVFRFVEIPAVV